jgi:hypothetical protein
MEMKILIAGIDGYLGWTLAQHLGVNGHEVSGIDNFSRRAWVAEMDSHTAIPIENMATRLNALNEVHGVEVDFHVGDLTSYMFVKRAIERTKPDCIVHFGEQSSAPFSMKSPWHSTFTHNNNLNGTLNLLYAMREHAPKTHLLKLGCFDKETEILTERGWKKLSALKKEDLVAQLDPKSEEMSFIHPTNIVKYRYKGKMLEMKTPTIDCLITPNHRVVHKRRSDNRYQPIQIDQADQLDKFGSIFIPRSAKWKGHNRTDKLVLSASRKLWFDMKDWLFFFGLWLSDGWVKKKDGSPVEICFKVKNSRKKKLIREYFGKLGLDFRECDEGNGLTLFACWSPIVAEYLAEHGSTAHSKFIRPAYLDMPPKMLERLLDGLLEGDGQKRDRSDRFVTTSPYLRDAVQEIALKLGKGATFGSHSSTIHPA